jgi:hypothetical protein
MGVSSVFERHSWGPAAKFLLCAFLFINFAAPAHAGFLDELFGGDDGEPARSAPPRARVRTAPSPRLSFSVRVNAPKKVARERARPVERRIVDKNDLEPGNAPNGKIARLPKTAFCYANAADPAAADGPDARLHDSTLRMGDSVVTADGILVFKGRVGCPHRNTDFVGLAAANLPRRQRNILFSLERTLHMSQQTTSQSEKGASLAPAPAMKIAGQSQQ